MANEIKFSGFDKIENKEYYARNLLQPSRDDLILGQFFEKETMPKNHGTHYTYRKNSRMTPQNAITGEGTFSNANESLHIYEYSVAISQFGDYAKYTDRLKMYPVDNVVDTISQELGYSRAEYIDQKRITALGTTKCIWYAGGKATSASVPAKGDGIQLNDLPKLHAFFRRNNVQPGADGNYVMLVPPEALIALKTVDKSSTQFTYIEIAKDMQNAKVVYQGEDGKLLKFTFVSTNSIKSPTKDTTNFGSGQTRYIYPCYVLGKVRGKWGASEVGLEGNEEIIHKGLETGGASENPLNQNGSVGWKNNGYVAYVKDDCAVTKYIIAIPENVYDEVALEANANVVAKDNATQSAATGTVNGVKAS